MTDFVFLHGGKQGGWVWDETIAALSREPGFGRAIALDIPGCGTKRGRDTANLGLEDVVADLVADLDAAGVQDAVLVGHSQAGTILPRLLAARPQMFRRAVYVSCSAPLPGQSIATMMGTSPQGEKPDEVGYPNAHLPLEARMPAMFCNDMSPQETAAFMARLGQDDWPPALRLETDWRYDIMAGTPATFVLCARDAILPPFWQGRFAERFGCERMVSLDAGHQAMNTQPEALARLLMSEAQV